jgi:hypothetical protein
METTMAGSEEDWIRHRAYVLWEEEGYPTGKDREHWERAALEYATLKPVAGTAEQSEAALSRRKSSPAKTDKTALLKTTSPKNVSSKSSAVKTAAGSKPASEKSKLAKAETAAAVPLEQPKKRPKKAAAE